MEERINGSSLQMSENKVYYLDSQSVVQNEFKSNVQNLTDHYSTDDLDDIAANSGLEDRELEDRGFSHSYSPHRDANLNTISLSDTGFVADNLEQSSSLNSSLNNDLSSLAQLIANVTESFTSAIFLADLGNKWLVPAGVHTLSRDFQMQRVIHFGAGLVGWCAENALRVSVCPFERDSSTLLYYSNDQALKSFIALPVVGRDGKLLGVIACDSKKSYAFSKVMEKVLLDCANQAATIIALHNSLTEERSHREPEGDLVADFLEHLRAAKSEEQLMSFVASIPQNLVRRDALVAMTTHEGGVGRGEFYTTANETQIKHRLIQLVCKHKKVICGERSVLAQSFSDSEQRTFLSVPFSVLGVEAGSLNLLSYSKESFSQPTVSLLENISKVIGHELERIRLRDKFLTSKETTGFLSWRNFSVQAKTKFIESRRNRMNLGLARLSFGNLLKIENIAGVSCATVIMQKIMRILEQVKPGDAIVCYLYGSQILLLAEQGEMERTLQRFSHLLQCSLKLDEELGLRASKEKIGQSVLEGMTVSKVSFPRDGETIEDLCQRSGRALSLIPTNKSGEEIEDSSYRMEIAVNDASWS